MTTAAPMNSSSLDSPAQVRVLLLFSASNIGGAERSLTRMALAGNEARVTYALASIAGEGAWSEWVRAQGSQAYCFGASSKVPLLGPARRLVRFCRDFRPHIVYVIGLRAALLTRLVKPLLPRLLIVHGIRSSIPKGTALARKFGFIERLQRGWTTHYIANSRCGAQDLLDILGKSPKGLSVIYNGLEAVTTTRSEPPSDPTIVVVANITHYKGHREFLRVVARVREQVPNLQVLLVGRNDLSNFLDGDIEQLELEKVVRLVGYHPRPDELMRVSSVFALPSLEIEGCPTAILEAMACGLPVVAYRIGGIPELVREGETGILVTSGDEAAMADALVHLLQDRAANIRMGLRGASIASAKFSLRNCAMEHAQLWHELSLGAKN